MVYNQSLLIQPVVRLQPIRSRQIRLRNAAPSLHRNNSEDSPPKKKATPWKSIKDKLIHNFRLNTPVKLRPEKDFSNDDDDLDLMAENPQDDTTASELILNQIKKASVVEELREFFETDLKIIKFPDYFSTVERNILQVTADEMSLGFQEGERTLIVYKKGKNLVCPKDGSSNKEIYVNVPELASKGKDNFIRHLRLRRCDSSGGNRSNMLWEVAVAQASNSSLDPDVNGSGGVYSLSSSGSNEKIAMFKPLTEEKFVREGLEAGEGAIREEAAYVLDSRGGNFSGVPPTAVAQLHLSNRGQAKQGSVQRFMNSKMGSMEDFGMPYDLEKACEFVNISQIHRIAILDIRLFNTDRHPGNLLLLGDKKPYSLVPIDHGCILPSWFHLSEARFDWMEYPQTKAKLSNETKMYIDNLDSKGDAKALRKLGIREECITTLRICTLLLKLAAMYDKTLHWMGNYMQRSGCFKQPSSLELAICKACKRAGISFHFVTNDFGEESGSIEPGILSRRPNQLFFEHLEYAIFDDIKRS